MIPLQKLKNCRYAGVKPSERTWRYQQTSRRGENLALFRNKQPLPTYTHQ